MPSAFSRSPGKRFRSNRIALSCVAPAGAAGLDQGAMGRDRNRPQSQILLPHAGGPYPAGKGTGELGPPLDCNQFGGEGGLKCAFGKRCAYACDRCSIRAGRGSSRSSRVLPRDPTRTVRASPSRTTCMTRGGCSSSGTRWIVRTGSPQRRRNRIFARSSRHSTSRLRRRGALQHDHRDHALRLSEVVTETGHQLRMRFV